MKYIRTKDGIYEVEKKERAYFEGHPWLYCCKGKYELVEEKDIIKQADTIEELCDYYIVFDNEEHCSITKDYGDFLEIFYECQRHCWLDKAYGAIKTSRGLIYVAKMNEKGELELL